MAPTQLDDGDTRRKTRRRLLKTALLLSAVGGGIVVLGGASGLVAGASPPSRAAVQTATQSAGSSAVSGAPVRVKVMYFQMRQTIPDITEERFTLESPAYFGDVLKSVVEKHPVLSKMMPTMMTLVDGTPGRPGTLLKDGDEVDLIPAIAGG